jgi:hypothetical protein
MITDGLTGLREFSIKKEKKAANFNRNKGDIREIEIGKVVDQNYLVAIDSWSTWSKPPSESACIELCSGQVHVQDIGDIKMRLNGIGRKTLIAC